MIVYKVTNKINGKIYIGKTIETLLKRKNRHLYEAKKGGSTIYFHNSIKKYSHENFIWEEIDLAESQEELNYLEKYWIKFYHSNNERFGYNLTEGGSGSYGYKHRPETIVKISMISSSVKRKKYKKWDNQARLNKSLSMKGKKIFKKWKRVICLDTNIEYDTPIEAAKHTGMKYQSICRVARGERKSLNGQKWKYINE